MIKVKNLNVKINDQKILNGVNLNFPKRGLIAISGPSGCGKTTLLNCLSGLLSFKGDIYLKGVNVNSLSEDEKGEFRLKNIGFIFQDYKLFENQNVKDNISFLFLSSNHVSKKEINERVEDVIKIVGLENKTSALIRNLSGGEKQRVAIARSIISSPSILLCDEPTGNLDYENSIKIMEILDNISKDKLVVVVSHDLNLLNKYADEIYFMEDGVILNKVINKKESTYKPLKIKNIKYSSKKIKLNSSFLIKYPFSKIKQKKVRSFISISIAALGLMTFGLSFSLSESISSNIKNVYASSIKNNRILMNKNDYDPKIKTIKAIEEEDFESIKENYKDYISSGGYHYYFDFENNFPDNNEFVLEKDGRIYEIDGLSIRSINDFKLIKNEAVYPNDPNYLSNNEIILGLDINTIVDICYELRIKRSVESLSSYLLNNSFSVSLNVANLYWMYESSISFTVKGFILTSKNTIYHLNPTFNQYIYETELKFPISNNVYSILEKPWIFRKIPYIKTDFVDYFLDENINNKENQKYIFEMYFDGCIEDDKIFLFENNLNGLRPILSDILISETECLTKPIYGSNAGHYIYPTMLMMGFSYQTYLSMREESIIDLNASLENISIDDMDNVVYPKDILESYFIKSDKNSFSFDVIDVKPILGDFPKSYDEIVLSSKLADKLFGSIDVIGKTIYLSHIISETVTYNNSFKREFKNVNLTISGIIDNPNFTIFHNPNWTINYYHKKIGVSKFLLDVNTISFEVKDGRDLDQVCNELNAKYKGYKFSNPTKDMTSGVDEVCSYVSVALLFFSLITFVISVLLMVITNYLNISENKKDYGLLMVLGLSRKETKKLIYCYSIFTNLIAFILSIFYLFVVDFLINLEISALLSAPLSLSFSYISIVVMFIVSILLGVVSSIFLNKKIGKISPMDIIRQ